MRRKINGRMIDISREAIIKKVLELQEFSGKTEFPTENDWKECLEWVNSRATHEELGGILGYWDVGDGTYQELMK